MEKLGVVLFQLPPSFTVAQFKSVERFLDRLPRDHQYAIEFRHPSWETEGPWELLKHYNVAAVMTDSPEPRLEYLSKVMVTADHAFVRLHGRNKGFWCNYLYSKGELEPWVAKAKEVAEQTKKLYIYFNNHYAAQAQAERLRECLRCCLLPDP